MAAPMVAQQVPQRDPQAVILASRALLTLTGGATVNDVMLTGAGTRIAGSTHETGSVTLKAKGTQESRIDLALSSGGRAQIRNQAPGYPQGAWSGPDGISHPISLHNCWTDAAWFFPPLSSLAALASPDLALSYVGQESRLGISVQHLRFWRQMSTRSTNAMHLIQRLSTLDMYLDSASLLPVAITFNLHPDADAETDIAVAVGFSDYRVVSGIRVPFHVQEFVNGGLVLDISITGVSINVGLSDTDFGIS
jgi:hypothetical protein